MRIVIYELQDSVGSIASQDAGCEAAVRAMDHVFAEDTEAMILVDAFNCLNGQVTLHVLNCEQSVLLCHASL